MTRWADRAACLNADPNLFDPPPSTNVTREFREDARYVIARFCNRCPVRAECLTDALDSDSVGIRGGVLLTVHNLGRFRLRSQVQVSA